MVTNLLDLSEHQYRIESELGNNREGGRITWKATNLATEELVAIKQFCFATADSTWSGYRAYEREIELLSKLEHSGIPKFIDSLETDNGFCLIQEYIDAPNLSDFRQLNLEETKQVLLQILDILIYLQQQNPSVFHRDLKPENILIGNRLHVYLVDFGFASLGDKEASVSSILRGTPGFMPPEQISKPTTASDLYSLGVTAICLLTGKKSWEISELASEDNPYQLQFKSHLPPLNRQFVSWLDKMVQPQANKRFADAATAKAALEAIALQPSENSSIVKVNLDRLLLATKPTFSLNRPTKKAVLGTFTLAGLSAFGVAAVNFALHHLDRTTVNLAIFLLSVVVITAIELAATTIAATEETTSRSAITIAVAIPVLLVIIAAIVLGKQPAVAISTAIAIAEIFNLSYCLRQHLFEGDSLLTIAYFLTTIFIGVGVGFELFL
ncbi:serine/threonine-protein kinase [Myxosarcina sp. GI1]|uniref:serine/threonine protein kinase n=1 Tax=Myxosarcina sp. GI1 TaxID=1541065 RepID=UPI000690E5AE|nr:serine/threonine-protein kinase [Myxosarcina sp. GI1]